MSDDRVHPDKGDRYTHYKGGEYEVISRAKHSETKEIMVVYRSLTYQTIWVRPLSIWNEEVRGPDGVTMLPRFRLKPKPTCSDYYHQMYAREAAQGNANRIKEACPKCGQWGALGAPVEPWNGHIPGACSCPGGC